MPYQLPTRRLFVLSALVIARSVAQLGKGVRTIADVGCGGIIWNALLVSLSIDERERERGKQRIAKWYIHAGLHVSPVEAADSHIAGGRKMILRITSHDADCAADGIATKQRTLWAAQYFYALDVEKLTVGADGSGEIDAIDVYTDRRIEVESKIVQTDSSNRSGQDGSGAGECGRCVEVHAGYESPEGVDIADALVSKVGAREGCNRNRHIAYVRRSEERRVGKE